MQMAQHAWGRNTKETHYGGQLAMWGNNSDGEHQHVPLCTV